VSDSRAIIEKARVPTRVQRTRHAEPLVKTVASLVEENKKLRATKANLTKRLAEVQKPRLVVNNIDATMNKIGSLEKTVADIEADAMRIRSSIERMEAEAR
jgi:regulator of replication initiation timing